ncbi:MAG: glycosyltransferase family A protein [Geminicoccaceae bacterium]
MLIVVCVCTAARPEPLAGLLRHLAAAGLDALAPDQVRLVVVDNRPGSGAAQAVAGAAPLLPVPVDLVEEPAPGISHARNRAVAAALAQDAELIAFIDDDDLPEPDWLVELVRVWRAERADMVFGSARHPVDAPIPAWLAGLDEFRPRRLDRIGTDGLPQGIATYNVLLAASLLRRMGEAGELFSTAMNAGGDLEFFGRARAAGASVAVAPRSQVVLGWEPARYRASSILYRKFDRAMATMQRTALHGTPAAELRAAAWRRLLRALKKLPARVARREDASIQLVRVVEHLGEVAATLGLRSSYYRAPPPASPSRRAR